MEFKSSRYNLTKKYDDALLIYNLVSNQVALLQEESLEVYLSDVISDNEQARALYNGGFFVESDKDELAFVNSRRHSVLYGLFHQKLYAVQDTLVFL